MSLPRNYIQNFKYIFEDTLYCIFMNMKDAIPTKCNLLNVIDTVRTYVDSMNMKDVTQRCLYHKMQCIECY